eukprot:CAMPEP_0117758158 /NCGR_PEP_ID=MMETSP0947-20121206/15202_1 /TAXON_ID=44440 /ORGANISM="Chattonella subsalsa, Strain CCMP2191" /LENGTH=519 /DNA_ID=CAMNT_0005578273 /DNA_START=33 /DNA_END=1592 /DNA_ORIENTATION=+
MLSSLNYGSIIIILLHSIFVHGFLKPLSDLSSFMAEKKLKSLEPECPLSTLPTPPGKKDGPLRNLKETISYLGDPESFIQSRVEEFGPIFSTYLFFKKTVIVGGQDGVAEFIKKERNEGVHESALPEIFKELHTEYGALNMNGAKHDEVREFFKQIFGQKAIDAFIPEIEATVDSFISSLKERPPEDEIFIVPELRSLNLNLFATIFSGSALSKEEQQLFDEYNSGLLALGRFDKSYKKGKTALEKLVEVMKVRYQNYKREKFNNSCLEKLEQTGWSDERAATVLVLFIWGAYIESASLMCHSNIFVNFWSDVQANVLKEAAAAGVLSSDAATSLPKKWTEMSYTRGVMRETLRLNPPAGGGFRSSGNDFELAGFRIPAGTVVTCDPRIGNADPDLFISPAEFAPERWTSTIPGEGNASQCPLKATAQKLGVGSWFPGGIGSHQCPGISLAEITSSIFLVKYLESFESWEESGSGLDEMTGKPKEVLIPIKIPVDEYAVFLTKKITTAVELSEVRTSTV